MERMTRNEAWSYFEHALTNTVSVEKGELACIDTATGLLTKGGISLTLEPIGYFEQTVVGDGTTKARVRLFKEVRLHWWDNDTGTPVVAADIMGPCYILDDRTVSGSSGTSTRSVAGRVWGVNSSRGVLVEMKGFSAS